jgi:hypothetical protein
VPQLCFHALKAPRNTCSNTGKQQNVNIATLYNRSYQQCTVVLLHILVMQTLPTTAKLAMDCDNLVIFIKRTK